MLRLIIITIDGPAASGKSTVARMLAKKFSFYYLSSGLLFRALVYILVHHFNYSKEQLLQPHQDDLKKALDLKRFSYQYDATAQEQILFDGINITRFLKDKEISDYASLIATNELVRDALATLQHQIAQNHNLVAEGRDMGSVIFPYADVKFFLTASLQARALRWVKDRQGKGITISLEQAGKEIEERDERDSVRSIAPLQIPEGAIVIDDSDLTPEQVVQKMEDTLPKVI